jgi:hypothetical protein
LLDLFLFICDELFGLLYCVLLPDGLYLPLLLLLLVGV